MNNSIGHNMSYERKCKNENVIAFSQWLNRTAIISNIINVLMVVGH